jgi:manganese transport protein
MGKFVISPLTKLFAWMIALVLVYLNIRMVVTEAVPVFEGNNIFLKTLILVVSLFFVGLLLYITAEPLLKKSALLKSIKIHPEMVPIEIQIPEYHKIAVALDFSENDKKLISYAIGQGNPSTEFILVHVVESASAKMWGNKSYDYETRKDKKQLDTYVQQLKEKGFNATGLLGFINPAKEIVRLMNESGADMLVVGTHGHKGIKDLIFGQTVNSVRHALKIPVLMVNLKNHKN